jgi:hypothetical protein
MGGFGNFQVHARRGSLRRCTWVCGPERLLVEEVVDTLRRHVAPKDYNYQVLTAGVDPDRDIWAAASTYPVDPADLRLVVVREAQQVRNWKPLGAWLSGGRKLPGVWLVFVSSSHDFDRVEKSREIQPHLAQIRDSSLGMLTKCGAPDAEEAVQWLLLRCPAMSELTAQYALTRLGGNLGAASALADKASLFDGQLSSGVIDVLCTERSDQGFADDLLAMRKPQALAQLETIPDRDLPRMIGLIDSRLEMVSRFNAALRQRMQPRDIAIKLEVSPWLVRLYLPVAKSYDPSRVRACRAVLATTDDAVRSGARLGVLETLCALW